MARESVRAVIPEYLKYFQCAGSCCEDSCCKDWNINLDRMTYEKYRQITEPELVKPIENKIVILEDGVKESRYARIILEHKQCPFLTDENLCLMQLKKGEGYLSDVCATYPRAINIINGMTEISASMSCPEVVRLALFNGGGINFIENVLTFDRRGAFFYLDTKSGRYYHTIYQYLSELRQASIRILQEKSLTIENRLALLGQLLYKVQQISQDDSYMEVPVLLSLFDQTVAGESRRIEVINPAFSLKTKVQLLMKMISERIGAGISSQRFADCLNESLQGLDYPAQKDPGLLSKNYEQAELDYCRPYLGEHRHVLENYLVNYVFKNMFPFNQAMLVWDEYLKLVIHFALIKFILVGMSGYHRGLNKQLIVKLVQSFAKTVENDNEYLNKMLSFLKVNNFSAPEKLFVLFY